MVTVTFLEDGAGELSAVLADGHADWAASGEDVVCAAVSAILQAAWLGLMEHAGIAVDAERDAGRLALRLAATDRGRTDVRAIVGTARLAIDQIARQYPEHVRSETRVEP